MRIVLDLNIVIKHQEYSEGTLVNPGRYKLLLKYVDARRSDLLIPMRDRLWPETRKHASARLAPFKSVSGYERQEMSLLGLKDRLVDDPLSDESIRWIVRKFRWVDPEGADGTMDTQIGKILGRIGMPREGAGVVQRAAEAVARHGDLEGGREDLVHLLRHLNSEASQDMQILAIAMKESEAREAILLTDDYDLFAFPIWRKPIDKSECGPVTMVLGPADARWIVQMRDGSVRVLDDRAAVRGLYSDGDYMEVLRALQCSVPGG